MTQFHHNSCSTCDHAELCKNPSLPTRYIEDRPTELKYLKQYWDKIHNTNVPDRPTMDRALLVICDAPGKDDDALGCSFLGWSGRLLYRWLVEQQELWKFADIYLTNACRCRPPAGEQPKDSALTACRTALLNDIEALQKDYGSNNVVLLAMGSKATKTLIKGGSIKKMSAHQGEPLKLREVTASKKYDRPARVLTRPVTCFFTYAPTAVSPGRSPELVHNIEAHLGLVRKFFDSGHVDSQLDIEWETAPDEINLGVPVIALDIETYGILEGKDQTVWHPQKMQDVDAAPIGKQVVSVSLSYLDPSRKIRNAFFPWSQRKKLWSLLRSLRGAVLVGVNMPFDMTVLRANDPVGRFLLTPENFKLDDISILNHLVADTRVERSLKSLSRLYGKLSYYETLAFGFSNGQKAKDENDSQLALYNCIDTYNTLSLWLDMNPVVKERMGDRPTINVANWRNSLLWCTIHMQEMGIRFDRPELEKMKAELEASVEATVGRAKELGWILKGKGSEKSRRNLVTSALEDSGLLEDSRVETTKVKKEISFGKNNVHLLVGNPMVDDRGLLPMSSKYREPMDLLGKHEIESKLLSSYVRPLLTEPDKGMLESGMAYPSWYPVPAYQKDDAGKEGGTKQGRYAATSPAVQTLPPPLKKTLISRYQNGQVWSNDLSQIELRMAALLSGDEGMMQAYREGKDIHTQTAQLVFPGLSENDKDFNEKRQMGKTMNFLMLYRGGAFKLQETLRRKAGLEISYDECLHMVQMFRAARQGLIDWQDRLIAEVQKKGFLQLITGWRRTFVADKFLVEKSSINEICNFPVQNYSAQVLQSAHAEILAERTKRKLIFVTPAQIHDDIIVDVEGTCVDAVLKMVGEQLLHPWLWEVLCDYLGREVPLDYGAKKVYPII